MVLKRYFDKAFWAPFIPFVCFMLYATAGPFIPQQSVISYALLGVFLIYTSFSVFRMRWNDVSRVISLFVLVQFIYYLFAPSVIISMMGGYKETTDRISAIIINFSPFFLAFFYSSKGKISRNHIVLYSCLFLILSIPKFFYERSHFIEVLASNGIIKEDVTVNAGYMFLELLLFLPLIRAKKVLSIIVIIVIGFFILYSAKRGSILIYLILLALYIPWWLKKNKKVSFILFACFIIMGYVAIDFISEYNYLMDRLEGTAGGGSATRAEIYSDIWNYCMKSHFQLDKFLFGFGFMSSFRMTINVAHNDWLELLSSCGLLGISLYLYFFYRLVKAYFQMQDKDLKKCLQMLIVAWFVKTFFSMAYTSLWYMPLIMGFILGNDYYINKANYIGNKNILNNYYEKVFKHS